MRKNRIARLSIGLIICLALLPAVHATFSASSTPNSGTIFNFPAIPDYENFSTNLTVTGTVTGTPTWTYAPAQGSPTCANYIVVTFGNSHAWNTTATFNDHGGVSCQATIVLTVTSSAGGQSSTNVSVTYDYCRRCL